MSRSNCPNCGAPYLTLGIRCDYCGTQKQFDDLDVSYTTVYAGSEPIAVFIDPDPITLNQDVVTTLNGQIANRNRMLMHDFI